MGDIQNTSDFLFYQGKDGNIKVQIILGDETVWATQKSMSEIFAVGVPAISKHLSNIFDSGELSEDSVISNLETTASDGKNYDTKFYNLDAIISVGYRVSSYQATQFRIWATSVLKEYMIKGFATDDERLKQGKEVFGKDYFDELLERIREIRSSERIFYKKITDIYEQCSIDYDSKSPITSEFFATVQNKLHYAITHHTAAEIINERADSSKENMGLSTWKNAPDGKIIESDTGVAKNYYNDNELTELNSIVTMYLDFAENRARRQKGMKMSDWIVKLDEFLKFNDYDVLINSGKISAKLAKQKAGQEFEKFRVKQDRDFVSDFDKVADQIKTTGKLPKKETPNIRELIEKVKGVGPEKEKSVKKDPSEFDLSMKKALNFNPQIIKEG